MITNQRDIDKYYDMLVEKNSNYEGVFFVGVKRREYFVAQRVQRRNP